MDADKKNLAFCEVVDALAEHGFPKTEECITRLEAYFDSVWEPGQPKEETIARVSALIIKKSFFD